MIRIIIGSAIILLASVPSAYAEVWMIKPAGAIGCHDPDALSASSKSDLKLPDGCVRLYAGERVIEPSNSSGGFADYLKVQRSDGSYVFVASSSLATDPGIGSIEEDRPE